MTTRDDVFRSQFEIDKRNATAQLLFKCARLVNERAIARIRERTGLPIRVAHTALFPHIDLGGTRQTVLADRLGISKQAVGQLVDELTAMGFLERRPDPADGRAKLVHFPQKGLNQGLAVLKEVEHELAAEIGQDDMARLREILLKLERVLAGSSGVPRVDE